MIYEGFNLCGSNNADNKTSKSIIYMKIWKEFVCLFSIDG